MKRFKFRLEKVLAHRSQTRDEKKQALQVVRAAIFQLEANVDRLRMQFDSVEEREGVTFLAEQLLINASYRERMKLEIGLTQQKIVSKNEELRTTTEAYVQASQELRAVELLRERKLQQFNEGVEKHESASLDEMSTLRFGREITER